MQELHKNNCKKARVATLLHPTQQLATATVQQQVQHAESTNSRRDVMKFPSNRFPVQCLTVCVCMCACVYIPGLHNNNNNSNNYDNDNGDDPCLKKLSSFPFTSSHSHTHSLPPSLPHSLCLSPCVSINCFVVVVVVVDLSQLSCKSTRVVQGGGNMLGVLHVQRMFNAPNNNSNNNVCCQFFFCLWILWVLTAAAWAGVGGRCDDTVITCSCAQRSGQVGSSSKRNEPTTTTIWITTTIVVDSPIPIPFPDSRRVPFVIVNVDSVRMASKNLLLILLWQQHPHKHEPEHTHTYAWSHSLSLCISTHTQSFTCNHSFPYVYVYCTDNYNWAAAELRNVQQIEVVHLFALIIFQPTVTH